MSLLFFTGFNGIATSQASRRFPVSSGMSIDDAFGFTGKGVRFGNGSFFQVDISGAPTTCIAGFRFRRIAGGPADFFNIRKGSTTHVYLRFNGSQQLELCNANGTVVVTSDPIAYSTWTFVEVSLTSINGSTGAVSLHINGVLVGSATTDTQGGSETTVDNVLFQTPANSNTSDVDVLYLCDTTGAAPHNARLGPVRADPVSTLADSSVQFTPSSGTNESCIDDGDNPDDDATTNTSSTVGHKDLFTVSGYGAIGQIFGVCVRAVAKASDGGGRGFAATLSSGGTEVVGPTVGLDVSYKEVSALYPNDPDTGVPFADDTAVNASLIGYVNVS